MINWDTAEKILIIGGTGFTGKRLLHAIGEHNQMAALGNLKPIKVTLFCRTTTPVPDIDTGYPIQVAYGDLSNGASLERALEGKDGLIHVASLALGFTPNTVKICESMKIKRAVFVSTTALFTKLNAKSKALRLKGESAVIGSKLNWTIIRPTMIFGRAGDRNMERLVRYIRRFPVIFVPGTAKTLQQPNFVDDVADAILSSYFAAKAHRKAFNISGPKALSFEKVINTVAEELGKHIVIVTIPLKPMLWLLGVYEKLCSKPILKAEQLLRLNENKVFDHTDATMAFGYQPKSFRDAIRELISETAAKKEQ